MKIRMKSMAWMVALLSLGVLCCVAPLFAAAPGLESAQNDLRGLFKELRWSPQAPPPTAVQAPRHEPKLLNTLLDETWDEAAAGGAPILLFDLDDTLLDTRGRHARILREFAADPGVKSRHAAELSKVSPIEEARMRYNMADTMKDYGVADPAFIKELDAFWFARFFDNAYFESDLVIPGGPEFVKAAVKSGATIVYITGRWEALRSGTEAGLKKHGYPLQDGKSVFLYMKPEPKMKDDAFKDDKLKEVAKMGTVVGGFENEPKNINIFKKNFPEGRMFFLDTRHSGKKDAAGKPVVPDVGIHWVKDYATP